MMLTWSDWATESRSNRYHYAVRFARHVPVLFVQPDAAAGAPTTSAPSGVPGITIVHAPSQSDGARADAIAQCAVAAGCTRPLLWIYNPNFPDVQARYPLALAIFHATEDYFSLEHYRIAGTALASAAQHREILALQMRFLRMLSIADAIVAVTEGVAQSYREQGGFAGPAIVLANGCDFAFWSESPTEARFRGARIVAYHGGINARLDDALILGVTNRLPDWEFRFYGPVDPAFKAWETIVARPNVRYLGILRPEELRVALREAAVGFMPYLPTRLHVERALPLKAFEYCAMGIPVATIAMRNLPEDNLAFGIAGDAAGFARNIVELGALREDPAGLAARHGLARRFDFEENFRRLLQYLPSLDRADRRRRLANLRARVFCRLRLALAFCVHALAKSAAVAAGFARRASSGDPP